MPTARTFRDVFVHEMQDAYNAEQQILKSLPSMVEGARSKELTSALQDHLKETKQHVTRLEQAFREMKVEPKGVRCQGMEGILMEGKAILEDGLDGPARDAAIIGAAQRVEHYETAIYGTLVAWAKQLGDDKVASLLSDTLTEEQRADKKLTELAQHGINQAASQSAPASGARPAARA